MSCDRPLPTDQEILDEQRAMIACQQRKIAQQDRMIESLLQTIDSMLFPPRANGATVRNLKMSQERRKEIARKAGIAGGVARRARRKAKELEVVK